MTGKSSEELPDEDQPPFPDAMLEQENAVGDDIGEDDLAAAVPPSPGAFAREEQRRAQGGLPAAMPSSPSAIAVAVAADEVPEVQVFRGRAVHPDSFKWGGFYLTWSAPERRPPLGQWSVVCPYHLKSQRTDCTKSMAVTPRQGKDRVRDLLKLWCLQADQHERKWQHSAVHFKDSDVPPEAMLESRLLEMVPPPQRTEIVDDETWAAAHAAEEAEERAEDVIQPRAKGRAKTKAKAKGKAKPASARRDAGACERVASGTDPADRPVAASALDVAVAHDGEPSRSSPNGSKSTSSGAEEGAQGSDAGDGSDARSDVASSGSDSDGSDASSTSSSSS